MANLARVTIVQAEVARSLPEGLDRTASLSVKSCSLPLSHQYGFKGTHRVCVAKVDSGWLIANPLAPPHSYYRTISEAALQKAVRDYPAQGTYAIVMPSVAAAFKTHPLA